MWVLLSNLRFWSNNGINNWNFHKYQTLNQHYKFHINFQTQPMQMRIQNLSYTIYYLMTCNHMILKTKNKNVTFINETYIYSLLHIKNIIREKNKINDLQVISFENFIASTRNNQLLQYVGGDASIGKIHIIKTIQDYFLKMGK